MSYYGNGNENEVPQYLNGSVNSREEYYPSPTPNGKREDLSQRQELQPGLEPQVQYGQVQYGQVQYEQQRLQYQQKQQIQYEQQQLQYEQQQLEYQQQLQYQQQPPQYQQQLQYQQQEQPVQYEQPPPISEAHEFVDALKLTPLVSILPSTITSSILQLPIVSRNYTHNLPQTLINDYPNDNVINTIRENFKGFNKLPDDSSLSLNLSPLAKQLWDGFIKNPQNPPAGPPNEVESDSEVVIISSSTAVQPPLENVKPISTPIPKQKPKTKTPQPASTVKTLSDEEKLARYQRIFTSLIDNIYTSDNPSQTSSLVSQKILEYNPSKTLSLTFKTISHLERCLEFVTAEWIETNIRLDKIEHLYRFIYQEFITIDDNIVLVPENDNKNVLVEYDTFKVNHSMLNSINKGLKTSNLLIAFYSLQFKTPSFSPEEPITLMTKFLESLSLNLLLRLSKQLSPKFDDPLEEFKTDLEDIHKALRNTFSSISSYLEKNIMPEHSVITIEDIASKYYFVEVEGRTRTSGGSIFRDSSVDSMRQRCMELILRIFTNYSSERINILSKMLQSYSHLSDKKLKQYTLDATRHGSIESPSAMFMRMVHISGTTEDLSGGDDVAGEEYLEKLSLSSRKAMNASQTTADQIIGYLIQKILPNKDEPKPQKEEPYKIMLQLLITDLLKSLSQSTWPAAETLITRIFSHLLPYTKDDQVYYANFAFDMLGSITPYLYSIKLCSEEIMAREQQQRPVSIIVPRINITPNQLQDILNDLGVVLNFQNSSGNHSTSYRYLSTLYMSDLLSLYNSPGIAEDIRTVCREFFDNCISKGPDGNAILSPPPTTSTDHVTSYKRLLTLRPIALFYDAIVKQVMNTIETSKKIKIKTKAFSVLKSLREENSNLLHYPGLLDLVRDLLKPTEPTSVRDAALDVFGEHIIRNHKELGTEYKTLCRLCNDPTAGVSAKKRAIEYCNQLLTATENLKIKVDIVYTFYNGLEGDDQSLIDLLMTNLSNCLLPANLKPPYDYYHVNFLVAFMENNRRECLYKTIEKLIGVESQDDRGKKSAKKIVETLFEREIEHYGKALSEDNKEYNSVFLDIISMFIEADGELITSDQLSRFFYILNQTIDVKDSLSPACVTSILMILRYGLAKKKAIDRKFLEDFQKYLDDQLSKHRRATDMSHIAVCLGLTCSLLGNNEKIAKLLTNSYLALNKIKSVSVQLSESLKKGGPNIDILRRYKTLIRVMSNLTRFCKLDKQLVEKTIGGRNYSTLSELAVSEYLIPFANVNMHVSIRLPAVLAIGLILVGEAAIYTKIEKVSNLFDRIMITTLNNDIDNDDFFKINDEDVKRYRDEKLIVLKTINNLLRFEEENATLKLIEKGAAKKADSKRTDTRTEKIDSRSLQGKAENTYTDSASLSIMQAYTDSILKACLSKDSEISQWASFIIAASFRQNFGDPNKAMKVIIALEASRYLAVFNSAKVAHERIDDSYKSLVRQLYAEGIKLACKCFHNIPELFAGRFNNESGPFNIIWSLVKDSKVERRQFLESLMKRINVEWDKYGDNEKDLLFVKENVNYVCFIGYGIGGLNFTDLNDALTIIVEINLILSTRGMTFIQTVATIYDNHRDAIDEGRWNCFGEIATLLLMLIRIREYLKNAYKMSEKNIKDYTEKKKGETRESKVEKSEAYALRLDQMVAIRKENVKHEENALLVLKCMKEIEGDGGSNDVIEWLEGKINSEVEERLNFVDIEQKMISPRKRRGRLDEEGPSPKKR